MFYTLEDLRASLGPGTLAKGRQLADSGILEQPNVQRGGELVTGLVRSGSQPLRVYARVRERPGGGLEIEGECSCRERRNCQHVAAVLLKALDWEQPPNPSAGTDRRQTAGVRSAPAAGLPCLVYLLLLDKAGGVAVETYAARRRGSGYGEVRRYAPAWARRGCRRAFWAQTTWRSWGTWTVSEGPPKARYRSRMGDCWRACSRADAAMSPISSPRRCGPAPCVRRGSNGAWTTPAASTSNGKPIPSLCRC